MPHSHSCSISSHVFKVSVASRIGVMLVLCSFCLLCDNAHSIAAVVDQSFSGRSPEGFVGLSQGPTGGFLAQTFTVGVDGWIEKVQLGIESAINEEAHSATVELRRVLENGFPSINTSDILASSTALLPVFDNRPPPWESFPWVDFQFTPFEVSRGQQLAIVVQTGNTASGHPRWAAVFDQDATYEQGKAYFYFAGQSEARISQGFNRGGADHWFTTFVQEIPEPTNSSLLASCVLCYLVIPKRQR